MTCLLITHVGLFSRLLIKPLLQHIPPHKRHLMDVKGQSQYSPHSLVHQFDQNLKLSSSRSSTKKVKGNKHDSQGGRYTYAKHFVSRLCIDGSTDKDQLPVSIRLEPISWESFVQTGWGKPLVLVCTHDEEKDQGNKITSSLSKKPLSIAEKILPDLLAFQNVRDEIGFEEFEDGNLMFVARFGKILFHGTPPSSLEKISNNSSAAETEKISNNSSAAETALDRMKRSFHTSIPSSYMDSVLGVAIPQLGLEFEEEKEYYLVKVCDKSRTDVTLSCSFTAMGGGEVLEFQKVDENQARHLVVDIPCFENNLDLRLMLSTRRIVAESTCDEKLVESIIKSVVVDPNVEGGLRWPLGMEYCGGRYRVVGTWHAKSKAYKNSFMRIKLRDADRFDFITSTREVTKEVSLQMTGIAEQLRGKKVEPGPLIEMLHDNLKMIWNSFLNLSST